MNEPSVVIYHNPRCGTSRNTLAMIRASGVEPQIIEYLNTPPSKARLLDLIQTAGVGVRDFMRSKEPLYNALKLNAPDLSDDALLEAMLAHPILINRPIVVTSKGVRLCRPSEGVLAILENPYIGKFTKEDGEVVLAQK